jgi:hypothetical protein
MRRGNRQASWETWILALAPLALLTVAGCSSPAEDAAVKVATEKKRAPEPLSKYLEEPQESQKGDVVVYEIDGETVVKSKFLYVFNELEAPRAAGRETAGTIDRDCKFVRGRIQDGKPLDPSCEGENPLEKIPTFTTQYNATHRQTKDRYIYEWERARYPNRNILRHRIKKL